MNKFLPFALTLSLFGGASVEAMAVDAVFPSSVEWLDVNVETPGSLGVEILYKVESLPDVVALRVSGNLNSADGVTLGSLSNIEYLDLSQSALTSLPDKVFQGRTSLQAVLLPENLESVGEYAFNNTSLVSLTLPASVKSLGNSCFQHNPNLKDVILKGDAAIPMNAFQNCQELESVSIAGNVKSIGNYAFNFCTKLKDLVLPSSITSIGDYVFQMSGIVKISLPPHASLGQNLFWSCGDLEEITFPENLYTIPAGLFYGCSSLTTIVCPAALPPVMGEGYSRDPFEKVDKTKITVKVPDYSLVNYKLDSEWVKFGRIEGTASYSSIVLNSEFSFANNRRPQSAVDVSLDWGGKLSIGGNVPFNMKSFRMTYMPYVRNEQPNTNYGQLINSSPAVTANDGTLSLYIERDRWYFFSFPVDVKLRDLVHSEYANFVVREYDGGERAANGAGNSWKDLPSDASLLAGKGYLIRTNGNGWINVVLGEEGCAKLLDNSDRLLSPVTYEAEDAANAGWNLLANPWPSYYDLAFSDLNTPVLLWDTATGQYNAYSVLDDKVVLQPGQAFFIQHAEEGNVKLPGAGRCFTEEGVATVERSETRGTDQRYLFDFTLTSDNGTDRTRVVFNPDADFAYEIGRDAAKFFSDDSATPHIYTLDNTGYPLAINERPSGNGEVQLVMEAKNEGISHLSVSRADGTVEIRDIVSGKVTPLAYGDSMEVELSGDNKVCTRYVAVIKPSVTSRVEEIGTDVSSVRVEAGEGSISVSGTVDKIFVYTADGKLMATASGSYVFPLQPGLYIVKAGQKSVKCIVR